MKSKSALLKTHVARYVLVGIPLLLLFHSFSFGAAKKAEPLPPVSSSETNASTDGPIQARIGSFLTQKDLAKYSRIDRTHHQMFLNTHAAVDLFWREHFFTLYREMRPQASEEDLARIQTYIPSVINWARLVFLLRLHDKSQKDPRLTLFSKDPRIQHLSRNARWNELLTHLFHRCNEIRNEELVPGEVPDFAVRITGEETVSFFLAYSLVLASGPAMLSSSEYWGFGLLFSGTLCTLHACLLRCPPYKKTVDSVWNSTGICLKRRKKKSIRELLRQELSLCENFWNREEMDPELFEKDLQQLRELHDPLIDELLEII